VSDHATDPRVDAARRRGFFPLVQLLERLAGGPPVGSAALPEEERIRFRHDPSLAFSTSDVGSVREVTLPPAPADPDGAARRGFEVMTSFLGLTGGVTPLPHYLAEEVAQEDPDAPRTRDFLDIFHHRFLSLLYRARATHDLPSARRSDDGDPWTARLLALLGVDVAPGETRPPLSAWRLLRLGPLLAERTMTAAGLAAAIADAVESDLGEAEVHVEPFAGTWVAIAEEEVTRLGRRSSVLGQDCLVGQRVFDAAGRFRVLIGPLSAEHYARFAGGEPVRRVEELVGALVAEPLEHEIVLWLAEGAAPPLRLGGSRLGKNAWLGGQRRQVRIHADKAA
jgi:type VI secretion system protein ImpH